MKSNFFDINLFKGIFASLVFLVVHSSYAQDEAGCAITEAQPGQNIQKEYEECMKRSQSNSQTATAQGNSNSVGTNGGPFSNPSAGTASGNQNSQATQTGGSKSSSSAHGKKKIRTHIEGKNGEIMKALEAAGMGGKFSACVQEYVTNERDSTCNVKTNKGLNDAINQIDQLKNVLGMATMANMSMTCSLFGDAMQAVRVATTAFKAGCQLYTKNCRDLCKEASTEMRDAIKYFERKHNKECDVETVPPHCDEYVDYIELLSQYRRQSVEEINVEGEVAWEEVRTPPYGVQVACRSREEVLQSALSNVMQFGAAYSIAQSCKDEIELPPEQIASICDSNPNNPICTFGKKVDCSVAANANHRECICQKNPRDPICKGFNAKVGTSPGFQSSGASAGSDPFAKAESGEDLNLDPGFGEANGFAGPVNPGQGSSSQGVNSGGGGGGLSGLGGGGRNAGGNPAAAKGGQAGSNYNTKVIRGGGGGRGAGATFGRGRGGSGRDGGGYKRNQAGGKARFNLKKYLPGGTKDPRRKLAGMDGLTKAGGPTLWEKVSRRYRANRRSLLP